MCKVCNDTDPSWVGKGKNRNSEGYSKVEEAVFGYTGMLPCKKLRLSLYASIFNQRENSKDIDQLIIAKLYKSRTTQKERNRESFVDYALFNKEKIDKQKKIYLKENRTRLLKYKSKHNKNYEKKLIKQTVSKSILMVQNLNTNTISFKVKIERKTKKLFESFGTLKEAVFARDAFLQTL